MAFWERLVRAGGAPVRLLGRWGLVGVGGLLLVGRLLLDSVRKLLSNWSVDRAGITEEPQWPKDAPQTLLIVRHGQSAHNISAVAAFGDTGADESLYDAPLSSLGEQQVAKLAARFRQEPIDLVLVSPLTRAIQTFYGAYPSGHPRVELWPLLSEHLTDSCDIGSGPEALRQVFPKLDVSGLPPVWWFTDEETSTTDPNHSRKRFREAGFMEPLGVFSKRVKSFFEAVQKRPERRIVAFGHSDFFNALCENHLSIENRWLENAEVLEVTMPTLEAV